MTPTEGRAEWKKWADRADELRRDAEKYTGLAETNPDFAVHYAELALTTERAMYAAMRRRDLLREYAPKETT